MDFSGFLMMHHELGLLAIFVATMVLDIFMGGTAAMRWFRPMVVGLFAVQTVWGFVPHAEGVAFGEMYVASPLGSLMKNILNIATLIVLLQGGEWLRRPENSIREGEFYGVLFATLFGMYLMVSAGNFMLLYLGIELASLPVACLVAWNKYHERSAEAGAKFILMTALSSGIMMFGLSYLYGAMGTMYFSDMSLAVAAEPMTILGFVFFFSGLAFKISLVPFHMWAPDVYEGAPTATTAYLSVVSKAAAVFALMLVLHHVFGGLARIWYLILWVLAVVTIVVGNLFAIRQRDIKRFFAYSSISQAGYILLGVLHGSAAGLTATLYFVFVYVFSNLAAFGVIAAVENGGGGTAVSDYRGLYKSNPRLALVMMLALFSLAGIPPLGGFFSKFFIFWAAAAEGDYVLVFIAVVNTVVSLYYYLRLVRAMFIDSAPEHGATADDDGPGGVVGTFKTDPYNSVSLIICTVGMLAVGVVSWFYNWIAGAGF
jgi:NADH-quinone oxidoreductase subunit N